MFKWERAGAKGCVMSQGSLALILLWFSIPKDYQQFCEQNHLVRQRRSPSRAAAQAQKEGVLQLLSMRNMLDPAYAAALGVNIDELLFTQPDQ